MNNYLLEVIERLEETGLDRSEACMLVAAVITEHIQFTKENQDMFDD